MVNAHFVTDSTVVNVRSEQQTASVSVTPNIITGRVGVSSYPSTLEHNKLSNRDISDQHPMSAITGLEEALNRLDTFTYEQASASDSWLIVHNLGRKPSVVVVDSADNVFYPAVQYIDLNTVLVTMNGATTGKAYLN